MNSEKRGGATWLRIIVGLALVGTICGLLGCGGDKTAGAKAKSPVLAEQFLAAIYGGSMDPMKDSLSQGFAETLPDNILAATTKLLSEQFGAVKKVEYVSREKVQRVWTETVWRVTAEKGNYKMKIVANGDKKTEDILLQLAPEEKWISIYTIGEKAMIERMKQKAEKKAAEK